MLSDNKLLKILCALRENESVTFSSSMSFAVQITIRAKVNKNKTLTVVRWLDKEHLTLDHPFEPGPFILEEALAQLRRSVAAHESM